MWMLLWSFWGPGMPVWLVHGVEGRGQPIKLQTLTPYSDGEYRKTLVFTETPARSVVEGRWLEARVWAFTDAPRLWTKVGYGPIFRLSRWYFERCKIRLVDGGFSVVRGERLTEKGRLLFALPRFRAPKMGVSDTLIFLTGDLSIAWGMPVRNYRLLGYSSRVLSDGAQGRRLRAAVWVRSSMIWTTMAHELGHRWGLLHIVRPYNLMLTGDGVRRSAQMLGTSLRGYFEPSRFRFTRAQCATMRSRLEAEQKRHLLHRSRP